MVWATRATPTRRGKHDCMPGVFDVRSANREPCERRRDHMKQVWIRPGERVMQDISFTASSETLV